MNRRGQYHLIEDHGRAIIANPRRYGLTAVWVHTIAGDQAQAYDPHATDPESVRGQLLQAAMANDWIRIRGGSGRWSVQFIGDLLPVAQALNKAFLDEEAGTVGALTLQDLRGEQHWQLTLSELQSFVSTAKHHS